MGEALLQPDDVVAIVLAEAARGPAETVPLQRALGRVTAAEILSPTAVPPFDNSAMDGFVVRGPDLDGGSESLRIVGESRAGTPAERGPQPGEAVRISTGAVIPPGAEAVVPVERTEEGDRGVRLLGATPPGANVRRAGEDVARGEVALAGGSRIGAAELGVLAAVGVAEVSCVRRPRVSILTTGDELVPPGRPLAPGQIYDASRYSLPALTEEAGAEVVGVETLPDEEAATREALAGALGADVVIVCGGVSVGRHDHVRGALAALAVDERFWRVALRPGKPTWFGVGSGGALVFGLPGNPVSAIVTFLVFVRPALRKMLGLEPEPSRPLATFAESRSSAPGRVEYVRCRLELGADGIRARPTRAAQGSHVLTSMLGADALAILPADRDRIEAGERVAVELLSGPAAWESTG